MAHLTMHKSYTFGKLHTPKLGMSFLMAPVVSVIDKLLTWQDRLNERANLRDIDARLLQDMGISGAAARDEVLKPFWIA